MQKDSKSVQEIAIGQVFRCADYRYADVQMLC
jgi:hypothetical protein